MMSASPSPLTSPAATRTPPVNVSTYGLNVRSSAPVMPSNTRTIGTLPWPDPTMTSARPSPLTSPAATYTPPVNDGSNGLNASRIVCDAPSTTRTNAGVPGPRARITSVTPSPLTSPTATRTPPVNDGGSVSTVPSSAPFTSKPRTCGTPAPGPVTIRTCRDTGIVNVAVAPQLSASVTWTPKVNDPRPSGPPLITPADDSDRPSGSDPLASVNVTGRCAPVVDSVAWYAVNSAARGSVPGVIVIGRQPTA